MNTEVEFDVKKVYLIQDIDKRYQKTMRAKLIPLEKKEIFTKLILEADSIMVGSETFVKTKRKALVDKILRAITTLEQKQKTETIWNL